MTRIQPLSVLLGLALAGLCFLTMSQATVVSTPLRVEYIPHPRDVVQIPGNVPYVVPTGKVFTLTSIQKALDFPGNGVTQVLVDGQPEYLYFGNSSAPVPLGFTVAPGKTITFLDVNSSTPHLGIRAWGYLAKE